jgi:hypothetical protein
MAPRLRDEFDELAYTLPDGDLRRLLGLPGAGDETYTMLRPRGPDGAAGPRAVLFHDSFADPLYRELLAGPCARLAAVPARQLDAVTIERERPDVVVLLFVERALQAETPRGP